MARSAIRERACTATGAPNARCASVGRCFDCAFAARTLRSTHGGGVLSEDAERPSRRTPRWRGHPERAAQRRGEGSAIRERARTATGARNGRSAPVRRCFDCAFAARTLRSTHDSTRGAPLNTRSPARCSAQHTKAPAAPRTTHVIKAQEPTPRVVARASPMYARRHETPRPQCVRRAHVRVTAPTARRRACPHHTSECRHYA